ncbi:Bro-N domain-containing protein [Methylobacterium sp. E-016]|uniref:BRO-N domain-containing protein n=1 Tax=Methylobacterium sp. E-016 TaxID=2836556 RepID=UPI001FBB5932|nr:Bro-N domain-containing protein [Methylobacterium sp. E-016]MCJ2074433.1 Bro-N domain-containing protein [Methylobacterium sp. E-016]
MNALVSLPDLATPDEFTFDFDGVSIPCRIIEGEVWILADTTAKALGHREAHDLTRNLDEDEKGPHNVRTPGGIQLKTFVSEAGLYKALLQRRGLKKLPGATRQRVERFQRLVFHEVLPSIRRTGTYTAPMAAPAPTAIGMLEALKDPATVIALIEHHARETLAERAAHAVTHQQLQARSTALAELHVQAEADRPKVLAQQRIGAAKGELLLSDVAVTIGVDRICIVDWLIGLQYLRRGSDRRVRCTRDGRLSGWLRATAEPIDEPVPEGFDDATVRCRIRVTGLGFKALRKHFCRGAAATSQDVIPGV